MSEETGRLCLRCCQLDRLDESQYLLNEDAEAGVI